MSYQVSLELPSQFQNQAAYGILLIYSVVTQLKECVILGWARRSTTTTSRIDLEDIRGYNLSG